MDSFSQQHPRMDRHFFGAKGASAFRQYQNCENGKDDPAPQKKAPDRIR
jgi:hypothetical protein